MEVKMSTTNYYEGIKHVVRIVSIGTTKCNQCNASFGEGAFAAAMNHYIEKHGYKILHVGSETYQDFGETQHYSVAILGK
jgi:hypothetical protein